MQWNHKDQQQIYIKKTYVISLVLSSQKSFEIHFVNVYESSRVWFLPLLYLTEEARYTDDEGYVVVTADSFRGGSIFKDKYLHFVERIDSMSGRQFSRMFGRQI
jgi:hypothetical protein